MRKLSLVLVAALAVFFAGCNKQKSSTPSIADTSAKQMQPESTANTEQNNDQSAANDPTQMQTQDQAGAGSSQDQQANPSMGSNNLPQDSTAANDQSASLGNSGTAQLDESQTSQAQIPGLPDSATAPSADATSSSSANSQDKT